MEHYKRLTLDDRIVIQAEIFKGKNASDIARRLKVSTSTITREVKRNSKIINPNKRECANYGKRLSCNQCKRRGLCTGKKKYYDFNFAQDITRRNEKNKKETYQISAEKLKTVDGIVCRGVKELNQSIHHIYCSNKELQLICSERTITRYILKGLLNVKAHELHRYVRFNHIKKYEYIPYPAKDAATIATRTYYCYLKYIKENPCLNITQFDSVEGSQESEKKLLTITFKEYDFQFGYIYSNYESETFVVRKMNELYEILGVKLSQKIFAVSISDNGFEFRRFPEIEVDSLGEKICRTFFTRPYRSTDKAECERNHEIVRYCIPKGKNFDLLTQDDIDEMFSNINSYIRKSKDDRTPYELVKEKFGIEFLNKINIKEIEKKEVKLSPLI